MCLQWFFALLNEAPVPKKLHSCIIGNQLMTRLQLLKNVSEHFVKRQ